MRTITFTNKGSIDPRSITTLGVNSKEGTSPIGYFGTGLKYAIAVLLRTNHQVTVCSGGDRYEFGVEKTRIRNDDFNIVTMNGQPLGFTTEIGKDWKMWMALRELYSNMLDEGGVTAEGMPDGPSADNQVMVIVSGEEFAKEWDQRELYFPDFGKFGEDFGDDTVSIYARGSNTVFFKGIRVGSFGQPLALTYNFKNNMQLTEDRTMASSWTAQHYMAAAITKMTRTDVLRRALMFEGCKEHELDYNTNNASPEFLKFVTDHRHDPALSPSAKRAVAEHFGPKFFESEPCNLLPHEERIIAAAQRLVEKLQAPIQYPIVVTEHLPATTMGYVVKGGDTIYLNRALLTQGVVRVAGTLFEENAHLQKNLEDCCRDMQNFLLDQLFSLVEAM